MRRTLVRTAIPAVIALAALLTGPTAVVAATGEEEFALPEGTTITLNDGTVIGVDRET
jgi:ferric-dicitrate binding protein FerR (iron transport regulator)